MKTAGKKDRLPYTTPQVEQVRLVTEESVLAGCKVQGVRGSGQHQHCRMSKNAPCDMLVS